MSTAPYWGTNCSSTFINSESTGAVCQLPLIGTKGANTNMNPIYGQGVPHIKTGLFDSWQHCEDDPSAQFMDVCNSITCPNSADKIQSCSPCSQSACPTCQFTGPKISNPFRCQRPFQCMRTCAPLDLSASCPGGGLYLKSYYGPPDTTKPKILCGYSISSTNPPWSLANLPNQFVNPMGQRAAINLYLAAWTSALFADQQGTSVFHTTNYLIATNDKTIRQAIYSSAGIQAYSNYFPPNSADFIQSIPTYPQFIYDLATNTAHVILYIYNAATYTNINLSWLQASQYVRLFTLETTPTVSAPLNIPLFSTQEPFSDLRTNKYYIFVELTGQHIYNASFTKVSDLVSINDIIAASPNPKTLDFYIIGRIYITTVTTWSPVLLYLFSQSNPKMVPDENFCEKIISDTGLVPITCFNNSCGKVFGDQCKTYIESSCVGQNPLQTTFVGIKIPVTKIFLQPNADVCQCYNSMLSPALVTAGAPAAMCFTKKCTENQALIDAYNLTDDHCKSYCSLVDGWLTSTDPVNRSRQPKLLDKARFDKLCGDTPPPPTGPIFNYWVLGIGLVVAILIASGLYFVIKKIWILLIILIILMLVVFFLAYDLSGHSVCVDGSAVCKSTITGITLPRTWCKYMANC